jgi:hypothetical protein
MAYSTKYYLDLGMEITEITEPTFNEIATKFAESVDIENGTDIEGGERVKIWTKIVPKVL